MGWINRDFWTPERVERLKTLWERGFSAGLIAQDLQTTRNAVVGKIHRLGLHWRPATHLRMTRWNKRPQTSPHLRNLRPVAIRTIRNAERADGADQPPAAPHRWVSLLDLRHRQCRWPHGDAAPFKFCGATVLEEFSYCEAHARAAYPGLSKGK